MCSLSSLAKTDCPTKAKMNPNNLQPEVVGHFAKVHKLKKPEDLICCIADMPGITIAIAPFSIAAQNGTYLDPRILIVKQGKDDIADAIFSINSGADHLNQKDAVEMLFNDRAAKKISYTDIDFAGGRANVSQRNPESCMLCHGDSGKVPKHGPRPIFDDAPWPRFLMEKSSPNSRDIFGEFLCPQREKLDPLIEQATTEAIDKNPRYKCIKDKPRITISGVKGSLEGSLIKFNTDRLVRFIKTSKDYKKFKYVIFAADYCGDFIPEDYIPGNQLKTMTNQTTLNPRLQSLDSTSALVNYMDEVSLRNRQHADKRDNLKAELVSKIQKKEAINLGDELKDSGACSRDGRQFTGIKGVSGAEEYLFKSKNIIFNRYIADGSGESALRFIFETRGIDISDWNMSATGGYSRSFNLSDALAKEDTDLNKILQHSSDPQAVCKDLKNKSMMAFEEKRVSEEESSILEIEK